ncbi:DUF6227 family protein [Streptomyces albidus (ex Kaewkla and Franco 2022)]|uniref:DUF6227 family protein n=1 Tax=Streptomyces albidus (ex Kaewkla and Franco 2022) TaxID=722709 RepID=UPI0015EF2764|nr:DUF6227 family protein [Streptomyces albidus (ex Kaewkla and Franco 2022)]
MGIEAVPTPAVHVRELLARAQNPFDITDAVLTRLEDALLCHVELHGWRHRRPPAPNLRCSSYRHIFILRDGTLLPLWELRYDGDDGSGTLLHEVYENEEALARSERRVHQSAQMPAAGPYGGFAGRDATHDPVELLMASGLCDRRTYAGSDSPDHARRLLRRAENPDRPGDDVGRLLATACGHQILPVPRPRALAHEWQVWCSVYEHAFLLPDGREISLYELEHDRSRTGELVCEVYPDEALAHEAASRRVRGDDFGL